VDRVQLKTSLALITGPERIYGMPKHKPFWEQKNPKKKSKKLTPAQKRYAKSLAQKAGRPYPNLIDNARASRA
jgi:hypothetical protein|tara:strand:- start:19864 stop:20082 length:219 start_codon:yes stop_codon:yes gene_type:complete